MTPLRAFLLVGLSSIGLDAGMITLVSQLDPAPGNNRYADVWASGDVALLGSFIGSGVFIIDISNPGAPSVANHYNPAAGGQFKDVKAVGNVGYFASDNGGGLHIVDISNPSSPSLLKQLTSADMGYDSIHNVSIEGNVLFQADSHTTVVKAFDISNPSAPVFIRDIDVVTGGAVHDVTALNGRLYTSGLGGQTHIYDFTAMSSAVAPTLLGTINSGALTHSNWVSDDGTLLVSAREISNGDIRLYDITNPAAATLLATIDRTFLGIDAFTPHNPILFGNDLLAVSWYQAGLQLLDISDPTNPFRRGEYDTFPGPVAGFDGNWGVYPFLGVDQILLSDMDGGLFIVDASSTVPEPGTFLSLFAGFTLIGLLVRRRRVQAPNR